MALGQGNGAGDGVVVSQAAHADFLREPRLRPTALLALIAYQLSYILRGFDSHTRRSSSACVRMCWPGWCLRLWINDCLPSSTRVFPPRTPAIHPSQVTTSLETFILRILYAAVWVANGLVCKVLDVVPRHREIVGRILGEDYALALTRLIGIGEIGMAVWILSGVKARWSAWAQIGAVMTMNVIEFFLAPDMLLFGRLNILVALAYCALVARTELSAKPSRDSCHSPS